ncbi:hypothetical protein AZ78_4986 [Lysobacter capsici AZ78]|uniref:Uncharacterized protein n=1 Tax=Lysobacter capsici AZ78 TaxID=1444315 RepID=A0A108U4C1_9GAMM|nr:hypothetical protein AZ78_4986 [Lysobacter capsici AZ78]
MTASEIRPIAGFRPVRAARQLGFQAAADLRLALALFGESALLYPAATPAATTPTTGRSRRKIAAATGLATSSPRTRHYRCRH